MRRYGSLLRFAPALALAAIVLAPGLEEPRHRSESGSCRA